MPANQNINYSKLILLVLFGISVLRLVVVQISPLNLHGDEAQYWAWSRDLDWGYFSKPPMIAWIIAATTSVFGNAEWAVRISSALLHPLIAYSLFRTGRFLFDARTGFWAALVYFFMPAVWLSSGIVSTDVPLLLCWAIALNALFHLRATPTLNWAALLGLAIGLGFLSKYAMLFFLIALAIVIVLDEKTRTALLAPRGLVTAVITLIVLAPNLYWNMSHDFATLSHTAANANLKGFVVYPKELFEFFLSQFGVFGPLTMIVLLSSLYQILKSRTNTDALILSIFILTPLFIICLEAFLSRANANWAVTAYAGGSIITAYTGLKILPRLLKVGVAVNVFAGLILALSAAMPSFADGVGQANAFKRVRGWPATNTQVIALAQAGNEGNSFSHIATDNRLVFYDLLYYGTENDTGLFLKMWLKTSHISNQAELTAPLPASSIEEGPILLVSQYRSYQRFFAADFKRLNPLQTIKIDLGGGKVRTLYTYAAYGYTPTDSPDR